MNTSFSNIFFIFLISFFGLITLSCQKNSSTNFSVEGKLDNLSVPEIYAVKETAQDSLVIDTVEVSQSGEFSFKGNVKDITIVSLFYGEEPVSFFLEPGYDVKIKGDARLADLVEIKGGTINDDIQDFKTKNNSALQSRSRILSQKENLDPAELKNISLQLARSVMEYVEQNPSKIAGVALMNKYSINNISAELLEKNIGLLKAPAVDFYLTTSLKQYYDRIKTSAIGAVAPPITLKSTKGKTVKLSDFKGKPVLLIFDLKDALSDVNYLDALKEAQKKLKNKVNFISILLDEDKNHPNPKTIEAANTLGYPVLLDDRKWDSEGVKSYNIKTVPYMLLVSPEGIIQERDVLLDSLVVKFTKEK